MLRNDLKQIFPEGWKNKFQHRQDWDPEGYGVASFDLGGDREKVLAINFKTEDIMEYFYDDIPDDEWISLDRMFKCLYNNKISNLKNYYEVFINKMYQFKGKQKYKLPKQEMLNGNKYLSRGFFTKPDGSLGVSVMIHRIIAFVFVPNPFPKEFNLVNHIDLNKDNFKKENLEWCDIRWNNQSKNRKQIVTSVYYLSTDLEGNQETLRGIKYMPDAKSIRKAAETGKIFKDKYWKRVDINLEDYLSKHPIVENGWFKNKFIKGHAVEANVCGILRIDGKLRIGTFTYDKFYYVIRISGKRYLVHRLIYETISGKQIPDGYVIDHIIPTSKYNINNEFSNLRLVTQSENMSNEKTVSKIRKAVKRLDFFGNIMQTYNSSTDASRCLNIRRSHIDEATRGDLLCVNNSIWVREKEENLVESKLRFIYYKFNFNKEAIDANVNLGNINTKLSYITVKKYLNTGVPAPDGFFYQQGDPKHMIYDPNNKELIKKRPRLYFHKKSNQDRLSITTLKN